ncbi:MAG: hypothetical protein Q8R70_00280, partial [Methanoregula sp.]|nr:hypothetical protein [Methanoregula sp.]
ITTLPNCTERDRVSPGGVLMEDSENTDINLPLHCLAGEGDLITITKDGTIFHNGKEQTDKQMELM